METAGRADVPARRARSPPPLAWNSSYPESSPASSLENSYTSSPSTSLSDLSTPHGAAELDASSSVEGDGSADASASSKSLPRPPRSVSFAPLPVTEVRKRTGTLGVAARARMLQDHRERRARLAAEHAQEECECEYDVGSTDLSRTTPHTSSTGPPWPALKIEDRSADDPLVKLGKKVLKGLRQHVTGRAAPREKTDGAAAVEVPVLHRPNAGPASTVEKEKKPDTPTVLSSTGDPRRSSVNSEDAVCPCEPQPPPSSDPERTPVSASDSRPPSVPSQDEVCPWEKQAPPSEPVRTPVSPTTGGKSVRARGGSLLGRRRLVKRGSEPQMPSAAAGVPGRVGLS